MIRINPDIIESMNLIQLCLNHLYFKKKIFQIYELLNNKKMDYFNNHMIFQMKFFIC